MNMFQIGLVPANILFIRLLNGQNGKLEKKLTEIAHFEHDNEYFILMQK